MQRFFAFFLVLILLLIGLEVASVYFIMPFPGSQLGYDEAESESVGRVKFAYWLHQNIGWLRAIGLLLLAYPAFRLIRKPRPKAYRYVAIGLVVVYGGVIAYLLARGVGASAYKRSIFNTPIAS